MGVRELWSAKAWLVALGPGLTGGISAQWAEGESASRPALEASADVDARQAIVLEGFVVAPDGSPVEGAVVVSSAGGRALSSSSGAYRLQVCVEDEAEVIEVTAHGTANDGLTASVRVDLPSPGQAASYAARPLHVDPLQLATPSCASRWLPTFGRLPGAGAPVHSLLAFDDGSGPALFLGGDFLTIASVPARRIARWDGTTASSLAAGMDDTVLALATYDDGGGLALYAGGEFRGAGSVAANRVAKWDGASWAPLGNGTNGPVHALAVFDDGAGAALYAGGEFTAAGGMAASHIARWNGSSWAPLGSGLSNRVRALATWDDGSGTALYAGGTFSSAGGAAASNIARWDGSSWAPLGSGTNGSVHSLAVWDDGSGAALFAGGTFFAAGGVAASHVAKWDGTSWMPLGGGANLAVHSLAVWDDGGGAALYAGGVFTVAGGTGASLIARWNGASWAPLGAGLAYLDTFFGTADVLALAPFDSGEGLELYAGGAFSLADGGVASNVAHWSGSSWSALAGGMSDSIAAAAVYDDGDGPALYTGGLFHRAGGVPGASCVARWDGSGWSALGSGIESRFGVFALEVFDEGGGPSLYVGGSFGAAGGTPASGIARWDGAAWSALGSGIGGIVHALAVYDDGSGPALLAGGDFSLAGGAAASNIAKWNGSSWSTLGSGTDGIVHALAVYDDGSGPALYVGGEFILAGGVTVRRLAKWNGSSWSAVGGGIGNGTVSALQVHDDGNGPALFIGHSFGVTRWDGTGLVGIGGGTGILELEVFDDGNGPALYTGGSFTTASGLAALQIARWSGASWSALGGGLHGGSSGGGVAAMAVFDHGDGPALYVGGSFECALDSGDSFFARWGDGAPPALTAPLGVIEIDQGARGEIVNFSVTASDCRDPAPIVVCTPPSGSFFPRGTTLVTCTATDGSGNVTTAQFPVVVTPAQGIRPP